MERVQTYEWDSKDTRIALVKGALDEAEAKQARLKEQLGEANQSVWSLTEQLKELEDESIQKA